MKKKKVEKSIKQALKPMDSEVENTKSFQVLLKDIHKLIITARENAAVSVNVGLTILYWRIGVRIHKDILDEKRASYGERILPTLSAKLVPRFGGGFSRRNLSRMRFGCQASARPIF